MELQQEVECDSSESLRDESGGKVNNEVGFLERFYSSKCDKLSLLKKYSRITVPNDIPHTERRKIYKASFKHNYDNCYSCNNPANERHHIIGIKNGGSNDKSNVVGLCLECHYKIHPWLYNPGKPKPKKGRKPRRKGFYISPARKKKKCRQPSNETARKRAKAAKAKKMPTDNKFLCLKIEGQIEFLNKELIATKTYCGNYISRKNKRVRKLFSLIGLYKSINGADKMHHLMDAYNIFIGKK